MIKITVELLPHGRESKKQVIAAGEIVNDGSGNIKSGNYRATFIHKIPDGDMVILRSKVKGFSRADTGVWNLILEALKNIE